MVGKKIKNVLKAIITVTALTMNYHLIADDVSSIGYENPETFLRTLSKVLYAIEVPTIAGVLVVVFLAVFYCFLSDMDSLPKRIGFGIQVMALFAAFWAVIGKSFYVYKDMWILTYGMVQCFKGALVLGGLFFLFSGILKMVVAAYMRYCDGSADKRSEKLFDKRYTGILTAGLILSAWLPTIAAYYPAVFMGDSEDIIYMAYNYPTGVGQSVIHLREGIYITNHHPVVYTGYISLFLHVVRALGGSYNLGIFLCAAVQCVITLCILSYSCVYCINNLNNERLAIAAALFYALCPLMPKYAVMISKDTFFADLLLLWAILMHKAVSTKNVKKDMAALAITSMGIVLIRKNGFYVILLTLLFAMMLYKHFWKRWLFMLAVVITSNALYSNVVLPAAGIPEGSIREMLSVPFQQTARYVKYHADEVTEEERCAIEGVLDYDKLADIYGGSLSDPVKNTYNEAATNDQLKAYFAAWFRMFLKHPEEYAAAFLNNYYGYFYPVVNDLMKLARTSVGSMGNVNRDGYFDFSHCYDRFHTGLRDILTFYDLLWMRIPVLNTLMTSAIYVWAVIAALFLNCIRLDKAALLAAFMYAALILTVLVGPSNAIDYERYIFPCIAGMPLLVNLTLKERSMNHV